jgi:hypothetical protein
VGWRVASDIGRRCAGVIGDDCAIVFQHLAPLNPSALLSEIPRAALKLSSNLLIGTKG